MLNVVLQTIKSCGLLRDDSVESGVCHHSLKVKFKYLFNLVETRQFHYVLISRAADF